MLKQLFAIAAIIIFSLSTNAQNNYREISLPDLMRKWQGGNKDIVILDVRSPGEYGDSSQFRHLNIGRIRGALNISIQDLQQKPEALKQLEAYKDKEIYVICSHSYRSRTISNLLLSNSFTKIINVRGGMSEWFRNYEELKPFAATNYEKSISYNNISPSQLYGILKKKEPVVLLGFKNAPKNSFDSLVLSYVQHLPELKNSEFFISSDSAAVLAKAKASGGKPIITYNIIGTGGAEMASLLNKNAVPNVHYLIGNLIGFYEYLVNFRNDDKLENYFSTKNQVRFHSAMSLCRELQVNKSIQLVDLRPDTLFAKMTKGTRLSYKHITGAVNFPFHLSAAEFEKQFPDKQKTYVFLPHQAYVGMELADALLINGYKIGWLMGGNERWEWYTNNVEEFGCKNHFVL